MSYHCWKCEAVVSVGANGKVVRTEVCDSCRSDLHACRSCIFYSESAYNRCSEPQAERVVDKDRSNFCDFFRFREGKGGKGSGSSETLKKLDDLFK
jgi:hypothetical protein